MEKGGQPLIKARRWWRKDNADKAVLRQRWRWLRRSSHYWSAGLLVLIIITPLALFGWLLFYTEVFKIQAVTVVDARDHIAEEVKAIAEKHISQLPLDRSILFLNSDRIETEVKVALPPIRTIHIIRKLPSTVKIIVQEKQPALLLLSGGEYYFVDSEGIVYEEARLENLPGVVLPVVKNDDEAVKVRLGAAAVEPNFVSFVTQLEEIIGQVIGARVAQIHIPSLAAREVHALFDNNWLLLLDTSRPAEHQALILQQLLRENIRPEQAGNIDYIDLRIPNRIYYRLKNSVDGIQKP